MPPNPLKIGALARRAGITVRTLHHYHRINLVVPSARTGSGHRLYTQRDIRRLTQVILLRGLGMSLQNIAQALDHPTRNTAMCNLLRNHIALLRQRMDAQTLLCRRMEHLLTLMQSRRGNSAAGDFLDLMEMITMTESYYTPEQLEQLQARRTLLGEDNIKAAEREWPELIQNMTAEMNAGTDPADPRVQKLARRWKQLVESFTGGDPAITQSLGKMWKEKGPELAGKMGRTFDPKLFQYVAKANQSLNA